ncbi:MAG TPA: hypothetical protein VIL72_04035 [Beijerinckiaceae bacterium]
MALSISVVPSLEVAAAASAFLRARVIAPFRAASLRADGAALLRAPAVRVAAAR